MSTEDVDEFFASWIGGGCFFPRGQQSRLSEALKGISYVQVWETVFQARLGQSNEFTRLISVLRIILLQDRSLP